jgi:flagellar basal-body rod protein FlgB
MSLSDLPLVAALKTSMRWTQQRHKFLAENVAGADVPGHRSRDLARPAFEPSVAGSLAGSPLTRTDPQHFPLLNASAGLAPAGRQDGFRVVSPTGHETLEDMMLKVAANQGEFQMAASLYGKSVGLIRTALGRRA